MKLIVFAIILGLMLPTVAYAQRGGEKQPVSTDARKMTFTDPTGALAPENFYILSDSVRDVEQIVLSPKFANQLPFPAFQKVTKPNGMTQELAALTAFVELAGDVYEMKSFRHSRTGISFSQFRAKTNELRPLNTAFHEAFRSDPTVSIKIRSDATGEVYELYRGTLKGTETGGASRGGR